MTSTKVSDRHQPHLDQRGWRLPGWRRYRCRRRAGRAGDPAAHAVPGGDPGSVLSQQAIEPQAASTHPVSTSTSAGTGRDANEIDAAPDDRYRQPVDGVESADPGGLPHETVPRPILRAGRPLTSARSTAPPTDRRRFRHRLSDVLTKQFGSSGGLLAQEYVVGPRMAIVQNLLATSNRRMTVRSPEGAARTELQADCAAGRTTPSPALRPAPT